METVLDKNQIKITSTSRAKELAEVMGIWADLFAEAWDPIRIISGFNSDSPDFISIRENSYKIYERFSTYIIALEKLSDAIETMANKIEAIAMEVQDTQGTVPENYNTYETTNQWENAKAHASFRNQAIADSSSSAGTASDTSTNTSNGVFSGIASGTKEAVAAALNAATEAAEKVQSNI